jgi:hypothetical protein
MKKICIYFLFALIFMITCYSSSLAESPIDKREAAVPGTEFLNSLENGAADAGAFTLAVERRHLILEKISPSAVANYMEALANNGILKFIPVEYYDDDEVNTALDVVFEDRANITNNWDVFENQWLPAKICR